MAIAIALGILAALQLALLVLDIRERVRTWPAQGSVERFAPRSAVFLVMVVLFYGAIQFGLLALVPGVVEMLETARKIFVAVQPEQPYEANVWQVILIGVAAFYLGGLLDYLFHRFASHSRPLWFSHENHHLPSDISVYMPGIAARPFVVVAAFPVMAALVATLHVLLTAAGVQGFNIVAFAFVLAFLQLVIATASHSAFMRRCWWAHRLMKPLGLTTPQEHWFHHVQELNVNFGNFTTCWDRVFGTYLDPETADASQYRAGLDYDQDFLGTLTFGRAKLGTRIRERFQLKFFCYLEPDCGSRLAGDRQRLE